MQITFPKLRFQEGQDVASRPHTCARANAPSVRRYADSRSKARASARCRLVQVATSRGKVRATGRCGWICTDRMLASTRLYIGQSAALRIIASKGYSGD